MKKSDAIVMLEELKDFLRDIGCGEIYGILGHDAGGILSHSVLQNDPHCTSYDSTGKPITCQLNARDEANVTQVWNDLKEIIDRGRENGFIQKLDEIIRAIRK